VLNDDFGYGVISPAYLVNLPSILPAYRRQLEQDHHLIEEKFDLSRLILSKDGIRYREINASKIIFCDGIASSGNPYFTNLPFAPNKGEALLIEAKDLPDQWIFKRAINIVPWSKNIFWVGSSYEWNFEHELQTENFRKKTTILLQKWLKIPFTVLDHLVSVRPATIERRPFIGFHPLQENLGIFNGMGTKGCSLAPYFAQQFVDHILKGSSILPGADVNRFRNMLSK
jgi:glycine/D-amino acid oxidase-like deaminating enzyme